MSRFEVRSPTSHLPQAIEAFALPGLKWTLNAGLGEAEVRRLEVRFAFLCLPEGASLSVLPPCTLPHHCCPFDSMP